jgi:hypothetical protein
MRRNDWGAYASVFGLTASGILAVSACSDQAIDDGSSGEIGTLHDGVIIGTNDLVKVAAQKQSPRAISTHAPS